MARERRGMLRRRPDEDEAAYQLRVNRFHALSCVSLAAFMTIPLLVIEYMRNSRQTTNAIAIVACRAQVNEE